MKSRIVNRVMYRDYKDVQYSFVAKKGHVSYEDIKWINNKDKPSEATLKDLVNTFENEEKKNEYQKIREKKYLEKELSPSNLVVALWEKVVEGRNDNVTKIQKTRDKIKKEVPKP